MLKAQKSTKRVMQRLLEEELARLKVRVALVGHLRVVWMPNANNALSGEVKGNAIFIYERDEEKALETLRHEIVDYCVSQAVDPYREVTNRLIKMINEDAYKRARPEEAHPNRPRAQ